MIELIIALIWLLLSLALFGVTMAASQFRSLEWLNSDRPFDDADLPTVSLVVPARNEAGNIENCLIRLSAQTYPSDRLKVLVVDDGSTDKTADIVRKVEKIDSRVKLIEAGPLPYGWLGKSHACWKGARNADSDWLCFVDADISASPDMVRAAVAYAEANSLDLLSLYPFYELGTIWEILVLPIGILEHEFEMRFRQPNNPASDSVAATGAFILVRRDAYESVQGHLSVRQQMLDDISLARTVKDAGYRVRGMRGNNLIAVRMYRNLREVWEGLSKNAIDSLHSKMFALLCAATVFAVAWLPIAVPLFVASGVADHPGDSRLVLAFAIAALATVLNFAGYIMASKPFHVRWFYGLMAPLGYTMGAAIIVNSLWRRAIGATGWKGRAYALSDSAAIPQPK